jgi:hypothetical protein
VCRPRLITTGFAPKPIDQLGALGSAGLRTGQPRTIRLAIRANFAQSNHSAKSVFRKQFPHRALRKVSRGLFGHPSGPLLQLEDAQLVRRGRWLDADGGWRCGSRPQAVHPGVSPELRHSQSAMASYSDSAATSTECRMPSESANDTTQVPAFPTTPP